MKKIILLTFAFIAVTSSYAHAAKEFPALDRNVKMTREAFESETQLIEEKPFNDPHLAYKIRIPKNWVKLDVRSEVTQDGPSRQILGGVAEYLSPPNVDLRMRFKLRASSLPFEITAKDWFIHHMNIENFSLIGLEVISDKKIQAHYVVMDKGLQYVVRAAVEISGQRMVLAEYIVPIEMWSPERNRAIWSIVSFALTNPDPSPVEQRVTHNFIDIAKFDYPNSWILNTSPVTTIERLNASLTNLKGGLSSKRTAKTSSREIFLMDGRIDITVVAKREDSTIAAELDIIRSQLTEKNLLLGDYLETVKGWDHHPKILFSKIEVYKVNNVQNKLADYEQWIGVYESQGRYYLLRLLTISRDSDYLVWARNVEALKVVASSLSPVQ